MSGRPTVAPVTTWADEVTAVAGRSGRHFAWSPRRRRGRAAGDIRRRRGDAPRTNGWHLAESLGGVARPYTGTAGRFESARVRVFRGDATAKGGCSPTGRWTGRRSGRGVRAAAGVPVGVGLAAEMVPARRTVGRAAAAGVPVTWATADAVSGSGDHVRIALETTGVGYVVGCGPTARRRPVRAMAVPAEVPRPDDRPRLRTNGPEPEPDARWLRIRRSLIHDPGGGVRFFASRSSRVRARSRTVWW